MNVPAVIDSTPEICPPREVLFRYARGGRDPMAAGHIARCDRCALLVSEAMEADVIGDDGEVIDITPRTP